MTTKFTLATLSTAVALALSGNAMAAMDLTASPITGNGGVYVGEQIVSSATDLKAGTSADQTATYKVGATLNAGASVWVRVTLPVGVTFKTDPELKVMDSGNNENTGTISQAGVNNNFVIFEVKPSNTCGSGSDACQFKESSTITFIGGTLTVTNKDPISIQIATFNQMAFATANQFALKTSPLGSNWVTFANAIVVESVDAITNTADVAALKGAYKNFTPAGKKSLLGFKVTHTPRALFSSGGESKADDLLADTNSVALTGDFSWVKAGALLLNKAANCGDTPVAVPTITFNAAGATITGLKPGDVITTNNQWYVCGEPTTETVIPKGSYSGTITLAGKSGYTVTGGSTGTGTINYNGTVLRIPFTNAFSGGGQFAFVQIQNNHTDNAPFGVTCYTYQGSSAGTINSLAVPGQKTRAFSVAQLGCPSNTTAVDLTFAVPTGRVNAVLVRQNQASGDSAIDGAVGNQ